MIEPRRCLHQLHQLRRQSSSSLPTRNEDDDYSDIPTTDLRDTYLLRSGDLEYETLSHGASSEEDLTLCNHTTSCNCSLCGSDRGDNGDNVRHSRRQDSGMKLLISFLVLVLSGTCHSVVSKLQTIQFYNYPNFLNLFSNFLYIPICFAYIIPVSRFQLFGNAIPREHSALLSKRLFVVLGALDCLATTMQIFASVYLPGPLTVLLPQATIPLSMILSRYILHERYEWKQYAGSVAVMLGILIVLEPFWTHRYAPEYYCEALDMETDCVLCQAEETKQACLAHTNSLSHYSSNGSSATVPQFLLLVANATSSADSAATTTTCHWLPFEDAQRREDDALVVMWSLVMIASAIPITLSTIYKQVALGGGQGRPRLLELDPIFLNGWTAVFQFPMSVLVAFPAGLIASPPVRPMDVPRNLWDGFLCTMMGVSSIETGCHPDSMMCGSIRPSALFYVLLCLCSNVIYTLSMMLLVKYGSTVLLFLAMTMIVPLSNLAFTLLPAGGGSGSGATVMQWCDVVGLLVIIAGLVLYRFSIDSSSCMSPGATTSSLAFVAAAEEEESSNPHPTTTAAAATTTTTKTTTRLLSVLPATLSSSSSDLRTLQQPLLSGDV